MFSFFSHVRRSHSRTLTGHSHATQMDKDKFFKSAAPPAKRKREVSALLCEI